MTKSSLTRQESIALARDTLSHWDPLDRPSYVPIDLAEFSPHAWALEAIEFAYQRGFDAAGTGVLRSETLIAELDKARGNLALETFLALVLKEHQRAARGGGMVTEQTCKRREDAARQAALDEQRTAPMLSDAPRPVHLVVHGRLSVVFGTLPVPGVTIDVLGTEPL